MRLSPKRVILLLIGVLCIGTVGFVAFSLFGPSTPVVVSPQTTYLTGPVDRFGRIDYVEALRRQWSDGVTTDNNAAVLIWQALGPAEIPPERQSSFFVELGIPALPLEGDYFVELDSDSMKPRIIEWMRGRISLPNGSAPQWTATGTEVSEGLPPDPDLSPMELESIYRMQAVDAHQAFLQLTDRTLHTPWRAEEFPPLVEWLELNKTPLELTVEASKRTRYYSPLIIGDFGNGMGPLFSMMLPDVQRARGLARALCYRAMLRVGEGQPHDAWQDVQAVHRLARLIGGKGVLVEQLVAIAVDQMALRAGAALLHEGELSNDELHEIHQYLMSLGPPCNIADSIDKSERLATLDTIAHISRYGFGDDSMGMENLLVRSGVNWNIPMQTMNRWYDRLAEAARHGAIAKRQAAMSAIENELPSLGRSVTPGALAGALFSRGKRSELMGKVMAAMYLPAISAAQEAEDRSATALRLLQVAAALAIHRENEGSYPAALEDLDPQLQEGLPKDPYSGREFSYERRDDGYVLWSVGPNLLDDGASGQSLCRTIDGEFVPDDEPRDGNDDDIVLRVPWSLAAPQDSNED